MVEALGEFFDLPVEDRTEFMGKKMLDPIRHEAGLATTIEGEQFLREFVRIFVHPTLHTPPKPLHFRAICEEYARQTREISIKLLNAIGESLGLEESYMENALNLANGHQLMAGNRYPPNQQQESAIGLAPHSDTPLISLVMQDGSIDGLQVLHEGQWVLVRLIPGSFFVHAGDLLEIVSNGRYQSLLHRVILNNKSTRMSIVTALGTTVEHVISPAPKLVEIANNVSAFRSIKYIEFVELTKRNQFWKAGLTLLKS